ncbi:MAG TPA: chemotaxis protein CheW [Anaeromyxobacteraceae bacterium]|nr:chemotaxis protein CheW [Anaeromyxobacteraceae bacterium]
MLHVLFRVGEADYVLPATEVAQMETFGGATRVPGSAPHVAGLVQIRGRVVPVIDVRARFGLPGAERGLDARIVVVRAGARQVGLLVDRAREVMSIPEDQFRPPPQVVGLQAAGFVRDVAQLGDRLLMRIDVEKIIGQDSLPSEDRDGQAYA